MSVKVNVKWQRQLLSDVEIDTTEPPRIFKTQLWTLTGVPPERQKILGLKGGTLKDDSDWAKTGIRDGMTIMLMGSKEAVIKAPEVKTTFIEDLEGDSAGPVTTIADSVPGLQNLGYTCYMNATVQCLNAAAELREKIESVFPRGSTRVGASSSVVSLRDLLGQLSDRSAPGVAPGRPLVPFTLLGALRAENPQFAEKGQHDAQECLVTILRFLATGFEKEARESGEASEAPAGGAKLNAVDDLFGIEVTSEDRCTESDEKATHREMVRSLMCYISQSVNSLTQGFVFEEDIEKRSEDLGRSAPWRRTSKISRMPPYLWVNFVRFYTSSTNPSKARAKILRNVTFPMTLDIYDFCNDDLKEAAKDSREEIRKQADKAAAIKKGDGEAMDVDQASVQMTQARVTEGKSGIYDLTAVLTHKGRALDSGHYVGWVKHSDSLWLKFDDDVVSTCTPEEIQKLSGGGDWHMAYMILYRARNG